MLSSIQINILIDNNSKSKYTIKLSLSQQDIKIKYKMFESNNLYMRINSGSQ